MTAVPPETPADNCGVAGKVRQTRFAFRAWRLDRATRTLHSVTIGAQVKPSWITTALTSPEGAWPKDGVLRAECHAGKVHEEHGEDCPPDCNKHDPVPGVKCKCGFYAITSLEVFDREKYLMRDKPVFGLVELGGRLIEGEGVYRAKTVKVAVILLIDPSLTVDHATLRRVAEEYRVPALRPHSVNPEAYREQIMAAEAEEWLKGQGTG